VLIAHRGAEPRDLQLVEFTLFETNRPTRTRAIALDALLAADRDGELGAPRP